MNPRSPPLCLAVLLQRSNLNSPRPSFFLCERRRVYTFLTEMEGLCEIKHAKSSMRDLAHRALSIVTACEDYNQCYVFRLAVLSVHFSKTNIFPEVKQGEWKKVFVQLPISATCRNFITWCCFKQESQYITGRGLEMDLVITSLYPDT